MDIESNCRFLFDQNGPFWHIATPGNLTEILFAKPEEYCFGVSLAALCALESGIKVYADHAQKYVFKHRYFVT